MLKDSEMDPASKPVLSIDVDGRTYFWGASRGSDSITAFVRSADGPGQVLRIEGLPLPGQDMRCLTAEGDVEGLIPHMIRAALARGWRPDAKGRTDFVL